MLFFWNLITFVWKKFTPRRKVLIWQASLTQTSRWVSRHPRYHFWLQTAKKKTLTGVLNDITPKPPLESLSISKKVNIWECCLADMTAFPPLGLSSLLIYTSPPSHVCQHQHLSNARIISPIQNPFGRQHFNSSVDIQYSSRRSHGFTTAWQLTAWLIWHQKTPQPPLKIFYATPPVWYLPFFPTVWICSPGSDQRRKTRDPMLKAIDSP